MVLSGTIKPGQSRDAKSGGCWVLVKGLPCGSRAAAACAAWVQVPPFRQDAECTEQHQWLATFVRSISTQYAPLVCGQYPLCWALTPCPSTPPARLPPCPSAGYATVDKAEALTAPTPVLGKLGGGQTPLMGNAKVRAGVLSEGLGWRAQMLGRNRWRQCARLRGVRRPLLHLDSDAAAAGTACVACFAHTLVHRFIAAPAGGGDAGHQAQGQREHAAAAAQGGAPVNCSAPNVP